MQERLCPQGRMLITVNKTYGRKLPIPQPVGLNNAMTRSSNAMRYCEERSNSKI
ncbi:MAG: hypothetical protein LBT04_09275 [Prevotellaceae bacterium]|nr:hypothetical protein [Prevotellaceae bacterium]